MNKGNSSVKKFCSNWLSKSPEILMASSICPEQQVSGDISSKTVKIPKAVKFEIFSLSQLFFSSFNFHTAEIKSYLEKKNNKKTELFNINPS